MHTSKLLRSGVIIVLGLTAASAAFASSFSDVSKSKNKTAIQFLRNRGVIHGYSNGTFKPYATINRAELAKVLVTATGVNPTVDQYHDCFSDVAKEWFAPYVCYAKGKTWVAGYGDGTFRPANPVNTVEAIKMILKAQGIAVAVSASNNTFSDVDFNAWYAAYVETANGKGLLETHNGKLYINASIKREGIAEMMYRSLFIRSLGAEKFEDDFDKGDRDRDEGSGSTAGNYHERLQQYLAQANAAADETMLTKDEFTSELTNGEGSGPQVLLTTATTFIKYTDPNGHMVLLALDESGKVIFKRPGGFGSELGIGMLAEEIGITTVQLKLELQSGKTIQQIAQEHGVTLPFPTGDHDNEEHDSHETGSGSHWDD